MEKWKNIKLDDESMWPKEGIVKLETPHVDDRGSIQSLVNFPMKNISLISSKKGVVRSNHYHVTDWHYMYILSGSFDYYYRQTDSNDELKVIKVKAGEWYLLHQWKIMQQSSWRTLIFLQLVVILEIRRHMRRMYVELS